MTGPESNVGKPNRSSDRRSHARGADAPVFARVLDSLTQAIFWKDRDSTYLGCNAAFAAAVGLASPEDVVGKTDYDLSWPREEADLYLAADREVIETGRTKRSILEPLHPAVDSRLCVETCKTPLRDRTGAVIGVLGIYDDVTDRRHQNTELREARLMLETVLNNIPARVFWKDLGGVYLGCNLLFARDAGLERPGQLVGKTDYDMGWAEQAELYRADDREVVESGESKLGYEEPQTTPDGEQIWLRTSKIPLRDLAGAVIGVLGTYEDITKSKRAEAEQRALEAQIQHAQKLESLGILAGGIAHDFNNLLVAILGHAELALADMSGADPHRQQVDEIRTAAMRACELTNQMLVYSGKGRFEVQSLQLNEVVEEMGHLLEASIPKKVSVRYALAEGLATVEADVAQIRQVFMNLVTNAAEACSDAGGSITLATGCQSVISDTSVQEELPDGEYVFLEVSDDGCGMDANTRERLFEPFYTTKFQGRGLGLAAVLGIVRGHGGDIKVTSEPGMGSSFKVLLAVGRGAAPERPRPTSIETLQVALSGTVLVVDDEAIVRRVARQMLELSGLDVVEAVDGVEALTVYREHRDRISLVLLDMTMPRMDGDETFSKLQILDPDVRVILASGYNEEDATNRFVDKGLAGFIQKPFTLNDLRAKVHAILGS